MRERNLKKCILNQKMICLWTILSVVLLLNSCITKKRHDKIVKQIYKTFYDRQTKEPLLCSSLIRNIKYYWKNDSVPNNGYRWILASHFREVEIDSVHYDFVMEYLGRPSEIIIENQKQEVVLTYIYYDFKKMPQSFDGPYGFNTIAFVFDNNNRLLKSITHSSGEY